MQACRVTVTASSCAQLASPNHGARRAHACKHYRPASTYTPPPLLAVCVVALHVRSTGKHGDAIDLLVIKQLICRLWRGARRPHHLQQVDHLCTESRTPSAHVEDEILYIFQRLIFDVFA